MSARVARSPWSKSRSSAIWRTTPEHTATAAGGAGASRPSEGIRIWSGGRARPRSTARMISAASALRQVPPVDAAGGTQLVAVARRPLRQGEEAEVRQHHAAGPVGLGRGALAPRRHFLRHGAGAARHAPDVAELPPRLFGDAGRRAVAQHLVALAERPLQASQRPQPLGEHVAQLQQVGDVVEGVGDLAVRDGPDQPVREPVGLGQRDAEHLVDQAGQRRCGEAEEPGDDLGVEDGGGDGPAGRHEHVEVLRRRVGHGDAGSAEDRRPAARGRRRAGRRAPPCRPRRSG